MSGDDKLDLDGYFDRIGYAGPTAATLATLQGVQAAHATAIAFENLDPLLGRPVSLKLPTLARKLVDQRRGGYCFEQNTLLQAVLRQLGFSVSGLAMEPLRPWPPHPHGAAG
jgi:N-hydroxyarylamine O-acetyltransferase